MHHTIPTKVFTNKTIMVVGTDPWNSPLLSKHRLVLELCEHNRVIYVEPFFHLGKLIHKKSWRRTSATTYHQEHPSSLTIIQPYRLPKSAFVPLLRRFSEGAFLMQLWLTRIRPDVIISFSPYFSFLAGKQSIFIYYPVDSYGHAGAYPEAILCENETLARADLVASGTQKLFHRFQGRTKHLEFLPHGVAVESVMRSAGRKPTDLVTIPPPIVGFLGAVNFRLNLALVKELAQSHPNWSIVLVGPFNQDDFGGGLSQHDLARLQSLPNIHLVGPRPSEQVGAYLAAFDVCIMPYDTSHPLVHFAAHKPLQCLAAGTPVVTTCEATDDILPPNTFVAATPADFVATIEWVLTMQSPELRKTYQNAARDYTWSRRLEQLEQWIIEYELDRNLKQRSPAG